MRAWCCSYVSYIPAKGTVQPSLCRNVARDSQSMPEDWKFQTGAEGFVPPIGVARHSSKLPAKWPTLSLSSPMLVRSKSQIRETV